jgi:hypothetical protein
LCRSTIKNDISTAIAINNAGNLKNNETTGQTIAPIIEPSETYLVKTTITIKTVRHISAGTGLIYRITANDVKTPLPPLKPKKEQIGLFYAVRAGVRNEG